MSIECGECEHDLRGGHAEDCSRRKDGEAIEAVFALLEPLDYKTRQWILQRLTAHWPSIPTKAEPTASATQRPIVIVESPYAGNVDVNLAYARAAMRDCLLRGEAPFASHALYTQPGVLDDGKPAERELGITSGFAFRPVAARTVVYVDLGITTGMQRGIMHADSIGQPVEIRRLAGWDRGIAPAPQQPCSPLDHRLNGFCHVCADGHL